MNDELKHCPFCGGEATRMLNGNEDDYFWWIECSNCNATTDSFATSTEAIAAWNTRADEPVEESDADWTDNRTCPNTIGQSSIDSREKLEADIATYKRFHASDKLIDLMLVDVVRCWLDRQAAITHELDNVWAKAQQTRIAELEAELKCYENVDEAKEMWAKACQRERDKNAELTAERDDLERANERQARKITGVCNLNDMQRKRIEELEAERDEGFSKELDRRCELLKARIAELETERDELLAKADELNASWRKANGGWAEANAEAERWRQKCDELRRVVKIQAESFAKMERELAEANERIGELERTIENMRGD